MKRGLQTFQDTETQYFTKYFGNSRSNLLLRAPPPYSRNATLAESFKSHECV